MNSTISITGETIVCQADNFCLLEYDDNTMALIDINRIYDISYRREVIGVDGIGKFIWEIMYKNITIKKLVDKIFEKYSVKSKKLATDQVISFIKGLIEKNCIIVIH